jgi:putative endopeptidase
MLGDEASQYTPAEIKEEAKTQHEALLDGIDLEIPYDIDYVYTHTYYSENYKSELDKMIDLFVEQYKESISSSWMDESTKAAMLDKVNKMKFSSLYPTEEEYKNLCISDDLKNVEEGGRFFNTLSSIRKNHQHLTRMTINHNVKDMHWWSPTKYLFGGVKPWEANAFFDYYLNQVFLCHMFLANIFVDNPDNSKEIDLMNLGYMAGTIGHEMGHAFDDTGNRFNSKGNIINTWSDKDADTYLGKVDKLSKIFDSTFAGCDYNRDTAFYQKGFNVVNESMADLGGLEIGIEICKKKYPNDDEALKKMFSYYAKQWVTTDEDKMDDYKLSWRFDDPHPMFRNRANTILSMTDDFYRVYNIKETDAMYVAPEDRVTLWN